MLILNLNLLHLIGDEIKLTYPGYDYIAVGQLAALYDGDILIGSGILDRLDDDNGQEIDFSFKN